MLTDEHMQQHTHRPRLIDRRTYARGQRRNLNQKTVLERMKERNGTADHLLENAADARTWYGAINLLMMELS